MKEIKKKIKSPPFLFPWQLRLCRNIYRSVKQLLGGRKKLKMAAVAMETNVQNMLNSLQTSQSFTVMFPVTSTSSGTR
jgi:hypothetical protein